MKVKVILNPYAGRWKALKHQQELEAILEKKGIDFDLVVTEVPGSGINDAKKAVIEGYDIIVSAGGDGSINEVVNGMILGVDENKLDSIPPLGIIPLGTANDVVVNLGLPATIEESVDAILNGTPKYIDLCKLNQRYFINNSAIGLEPTITLIQASQKRLKGILRYVIAALIGIHQNPIWDMKIKWDDGEYEGPSNLVSVGNSPLTGGVFYMTPHADAFDGKLTFIYGHIPTRWEILKIFPRTTKSGDGSFVEHPDINEIHTTSLRISTQPGTPAHTDGEIVSEDINTMNYSIEQERFPILFPSGK